MDQSPEAQRIMNVSKDAEPLNDSRGWMNVEVEINIDQFRGRKSIYYLQCHFVS